MKPDKPLKQTKQDKAWQERVEKKVKDEKIALDHPEGKERFERTIRHTRDTPKRKD